MKTSHIFILSVLAISGTFFGVLSLFESPETVIEQVTLDIILGSILYVGYLVFATIYSSSKTRKPYSVRKATA